MKTQKEHLAVLAEQVECHNCDEAVLKSNAQWSTQWKVWTCNDCLTEENDDI